MNVIINQLFEIEKKALEQNIDGFDRNLKRIYHELEEKGYKIVNPLGTNYDERDSSIDANILNANSKKITKVIRPAIYKTENDTFQLVQKAVVIVE
jgi:predicted phage tail protein